MLVRGGGGAMGDVSPPSGGAALPPSLHSDGKPIAWQSLCGWQRFLNMTCCLRKLPRAIARLNVAYLLKAFVGNVVVYF